MDLPGWNNWGVTCWDCTVAVGVKKRQHWKTNEKQQRLQLLIRYFISRSQMRGSQLSSCELKASFASLFPIFADSNPTEMTPFGPTITYPENKVMLVMPLQNISSLISWWHTHTLRPHVLTIAEALPLRHYTPYLFISSDSMQIVPLIGVLIIGVKILPYSSISSTHSGLPNITIRKWHQTMQSTTSYNNWFSQHLRTSFIHNICFQSSIFSSSTLSHSHSLGKSRCSISVLLIISSVTHGKPVLCMMSAH